MGALLVRCETVAPRCAAPESARPSADSAGAKLIHPFARARRMRVSVTDRGLSSWGKLAALTVAALCCFAANSLLCRMALRPGLIDPVSFMSVRLLSGAAVLWLLAQALDPAGGRV